MKDYYSKIAIIGLGYVGLPIAIAFAKKNVKVIGYDLDKQKINNLLELKDTNNILHQSETKYLKKIFFTNKISDIQISNVLVVCVPTPINKKNNPNLSYLKLASKEIGKILNDKKIIIFESTVYPGVTEDICIPIIEKYSETKINKGFYCGYSPERINPGDSSRNFSNINKIISASNNYSLKIIKKIYFKVINASIHSAKSIKIAEAAKVLENTQRDINIGLMNEFNEICSKLKISTAEVLQAASTKWNFLDFKPGFVAGHCISVDPYYLSFKAKELGLDPKIILSSRSTNDKVPHRLSKKINEYFIKNKILNPKIIFFGITYKNNVSDIRNSGAIKLIELSKKKYFVHSFDPNAVIDKKISKKINLINIPKKKFYDLIVINTNHKYFIKNYKFNNVKILLKKDGRILDPWNFFKAKDSSFIIKN